jgi:VanZ family protein
VRPPEVPPPLLAPRWRLALATAAVLYAALIYWLSSLGNPLPFIHTWFPGEDKVLHASGYALLGALLASALIGLVRPGRALLLAVVLASLYGVTDEWHQSFVPGRTSDPLDWTADTVGALGGAALAIALVASLRRRGARASIRP